MAPDDAVKLAFFGLFVGVFVLTYILTPTGGSGHFGPTLVIQSSHVSKEENYGAYVVLQGRPMGIFAFVLNCLRLGKVVRFEVSKTCVSKRTMSLTSRLTQTIPCQNVASTEYGYSRSLFLLFLMAFFLLLAVGSLLVPKLADRVGPFADPAEVERQMDLPWKTEWYKIIPIVCSGATLFFFLSFWLSKRLVIEVESSGGKRIGIHFRPGIIEGVPLTIKTAEDIVHTINSLADKR